MPRSKVIRLTHRIPFHGAVLRACMECWCHFDYCVSLKLCLISFCIFLHFIFNPLLVIVCESATHLCRKIKIRPNPPADLKDRVVKVSINLFSDGFAAQGRRKAIGGHYMFLANSSRAMRNKQKSIKAIGFQHPGSLHFIRLGFFVVDSVNLFYCSNVRFLYIYFQLDRCRRVCIHGAVHQAFGSNGAWNSS